MITKDMARQFCAAVNGAEAGDIISLTPDVVVCGREMPDAWCTIRHDGKQHFASTQEAYDELCRLQSEAVKNLNALAKGE